jgi:hypothetical protein
MDFAYHDSMRIKHRTQLFNVASEQTIKIAGLQALRYCCDLR